MALVSAPALNALSLGDDVARSLGHSVRRTYRWLLPASALSGSVLLLLGDVLGRVLVRPGELQVGIVLALVGAPFFIYLVRRRKMMHI